MPKSKSETVEDLDSFVKVWANKVRRGKYIAMYARVDKLLVLVPATSTDPQWYTYMDGVSQDDAVKIGDKYDLDMVFQTIWDWEADRMRAKGEE